eukprot:jgi/Chlat1/1965/Chrsp158S00124
MSSYLSAPALGASCGAWRRVGPGTSGLLSDSEAQQRTAWSDPEVGVQMETSKAALVSCGNKACGVPLSEVYEGWPRSSGQPTPLCSKCSSLFEAGTFCEEYHQEEDGWRSCVTCQKKLHCGCIVSSSSYLFDDAGGVQCVSCQVQKNGPVAGSSGQVAENVEVVSTGGEGKTAMRRPTVRRPRERRLVPPAHVTVPQPSGQPHEEGSALDGFLKAATAQVLESPNGILQRNAAYVLAEGLPQSQLPPRPPPPPSEQAPTDTESDQKTTSSDSKVTKEGAIPTAQQRSRRKSKARQFRTEFMDAVSCDDPVSQPVAPIPKNSRPPQPPLQAALQGNRRLVCLFEKQLTSSDTGKLGRIVLPKAHAEQHLPRIDTPDGRALQVTDTNGRSWAPRFRFWPNNNSRMYLLEGITEILHSLHLQTGDSVTFNKDVVTGKLVIGARKRVRGPNDHIPLPLDLDKNKMAVGSIKKSKLSSGVSKKSKRDNENMPLDMAGEYSNKRQKLHSGSLKSPRLPPTVTILDGFRIEEYMARPLLRDIQAQRLALEGTPLATGVH